MFPQGVEFFDEKLNTLCMAWLIDHGKKQFLCFQSGFMSMWAQFKSMLALAAKGFWTKIPFFLSLKFVRHHSCVQQIFSACSWKSVHLKIAGCSSSTNV